MVAAIACFFRTQQERVRKDAAGRRERWRREDQWEDYRNADEAGKAYLRALWGEPWYAAQQALKKAALAGEENKP